MNSEINYFEIFTFLNEKGIIFPPVRTTHIKPKKVSKQMDTSYKLIIPNVYNNKNGKKP